MTGLRHLAAVHPVAALAAGLTLLVLFIAVGLLEGQTAGRRRR